MTDGLDAQSIQIFRSALSELRSHQAKHNYNISFCQNHDLLSQWRGYGASRGVCLEFDSVELEEQLDFGFSKVLSRSVFYTQAGGTLEAKDEILAFLANEDFIEKKKGSPFFEFVGANELMNRLTPFFKHESFREESEYRIVIQPDLQSVPVKFRVNAHGLIPYIDIRAKSDSPFTGKLPLRGVKIGPCKDRSFVAEGVNFLLGSKGYREVECTFTETPFRG